MEMRMARMIGICGMLVLIPMGCGKVSKDHSKVLASVGSEKITEKTFGETVHTWIGDDAKAKDLLSNQAMRDQRNQILGSLVNQKALFQFVKSEGLDKDPKVQILIASATADAYFQIMADRKMTKAEPTDAQLKTFYDDYSLQAKAANQPVPPFDQVKAQLPAAWKRKQSEIAREALLGELNKKYPVVFAPDYKPSQMP